MRPGNFILLAGFVMVGTSAWPGQLRPVDAADDAAAFGALEAIYAASLSADGKRLVYVGAGTGINTVAVVVDLKTGVASKVARADGDPTRLTRCDWSAADRLVCSLYGLETVQVKGTLLPITRTLAMDMDGGNQVFLGERDSFEQLQKRQSDGEVVDWLNGRDGTVLMARSHVPEKTTGRLMPRNLEGLGVDLIDTRTGKTTSIERPGRDITRYISDGLGNIRIMTSTAVADTGYMNGVDSHSYRVADDRQWRPLGSFTLDASIGRGGTGMIPLAIDPDIDAAYVLESLDGRNALFRIALDGTLKRDLVFAAPRVDVSDVVRIGRSGRVIGASYATDRRYVEYFDPDYKALHDLLARSLPDLPLIEFLGASADEKKLIVRASSDIEPGNWYVYDRESKALSLVSSERPRLKDRTLSPVRVVSYPAADGTPIPAYLTLPAQVTVAKHLPAIVMPHGGPAARDVWGFDWMAQYFATHGYAVLQPNFRGSSGYGDAWFADNGYRGWRISVGDVCDGGRWLVSQGIADPSRLAILGWSYGGYAALQANVLDADLFKAVIAIAPVTDLGKLRTQRMVYTNAFLEADYIGSGSQVKEGSPIQYAETFKAPVLMFHGGNDLNVDVLQSRRMDKQLRDARKSSELVVYPDLEHDLRDGSVRADLLRRSEEFLRTRLKLE